jgi:eukaryotic-like serine/threonine-protein kinase
MAAGAEREHLLKVGQKVRVADGPGEALVLRYIKAGGQAEVYETRVFDLPAALKWYLPTYLSEDPDLWDRLDRIILSAAPSESFLWPYARVKDSHVPGFGYLMPLLPPGRIGFNELIYGNVERSFHLLARIGFSVSNEIRRLHLQGLCYRDLNPGNFFYNPGTGQVDVLDNDNIDVDEDRNKAPALGVIEFAAPELLNRTARPSRYTDLWSLAVLLFHVTVLAHPMQGKRELLYQSYDAARFDLHAKPVFIFDPADHSNGPLEGAPGDNARALWPCYPQGLRNLFIRAFTDGISKPSARPTEGEWEEEFQRVIDGVFACQFCGRENIADFSGSSERQICQLCREVTQGPAVLRIDRWAIAIRPGARVWRHHLGRQRDHEIDRPIAEVTESPLHLRNLTAEAWTAHDGDGRTLTAAPGELLPLTDRMHIHFGLRSGMVQDGVWPSVKP